MTSFKQLFARLEQAVRPNRGNALFALFLTVLCQTVLSMFFLAPVVFLLMRGGVTFNERLFGYLLVFCALVVQTLFQYGLQVLILRMVRREFVTLGYVFYGFKTIKRTLPLAVAVSALIFALALAFFLVARSVVAARLDANLGAEALLSAQEILRQLRVPTLLLFALGVLVLVAVGIRFIFVFFLHVDHPGEKLPSLFRKSARLMRKRCFLLIRLALRAGGRNFVIAAVALCVMTGMTAAEGADDGQQLFPAFVGMIVNLVYLVNIYTALLKMYFAAPVLYVDAVQPVVDVTVADDAARAGDAVSADDGVSAVPADGEPAAKDAAGDTGER